MILRRNYVRNVGVFVRAVAYFFAWRSFFFCASDIVIADAHVCMCMWINRQKEYIILLVNSKLCILRVSPAFGRCRLREQSIANAI
jgi:hypothetical protein